MTNKHPHAEMIKAKVDDMSLVVFYLESNTGSKVWKVRKNNNKTHFNPRFDYFLCLPKHKDAVFHSLNGGDVEAADEDCLFVDVAATNWSMNLWCMHEHYESRIKPRKEKRWIGIHKSGKTTDAFETREGAEHDSLNYIFITALKDGPNCKCWQFKEIEVEV